MKYIKKSLLTLISALSFLACNATAEGPSIEAPPVVTIFVHGTKPQIHDWFYKLGEYYFKPGLEHVDNQCKDHGPNDIIAGLKGSGYVDPAHLYFYGWCGKLSAKERLEAACTLMKCIEQLIEQYLEKYGCMPKLQIITHSHGGNVGLYLVHELEKKQSNIIIDELVLLAPPVQSWTKEYIGSAHCKKVYNFYSAGDLIQTVDPQGIQMHLNNDTVQDKPDFFKLSDRTFDHHDNLTQIRIKINNTNPWHITFIDLVYPRELRTHFPHQFPRFLPELGKILAEVNKKNVQKQIKLHKKPVMVKINTRKDNDNGRITVYI